MDDVCTAVELLLKISRSEISQGNPQEALAAVIHAITLTRGEDAVADVLQQAKRRVDEENERKSMIDTLKMAREISKRLVREETILSERGEQTILRDAFEDGSSVVCSKCGSLVPRARSEEHSLYWCEYATSDIDDDIF
mmetsp:Transcript_13647/g.20450  ORF Transcript_13647/g.20450 Transcript_13647/m.20450 type:complete len:139 (+) Transcript_13647:43-459(+)